MKRRRRARRAVVAGAGLAVGATLLGASVGVSALVLVLSAPVAGMTYGVLEFMDGRTRR